MQLQLPLSSEQPQEKSQVQDWVPLRVDTEVHILQVQD